MLETTPNPASENASAETHEPGSDEAAAAAFAAKSTPRDERGVDAAPTEEAGDEPAADDSDEEAAEADPDADDKPAAEAVEVEFEGKTYTVAPELQKALLRQADYSRQMNATKAAEATYKARIEAIEAIEQAADQKADAQAAIKSLDAQIKQYEGIDWAKAKAERPGEAALAAVELLGLRQQRDDAERAANAVAQKVTEGREKLLTEQRAEMEKTLSRDLKGWGNELGTKLTAYALEKGAKVETLRGLTDPAVVIALNKARLYDELQQGKEALRKQTKDVPPVLKPGAPRKSDPGTDAMSRLRKSKSDEDAIAAFKSRTLN